MPAIEAGSNCEVVLWDHTITAWLDKGFFKTTPRKGLFIAGTVGV